MKKRFLAAVLCIVLTGVSLSGCGILSMGNKALQEAENSNYEVEQTENPDKDSSEKDDSAESDSSKDGANKADSEALIKKNEETSNNKSNREFEETEKITYSLDQANDQFEVPVDGRDWNSSLVYYNVANINIETAGYEHLVEAVDAYNSEAYEEAIYEFEELSDKALKNKAEMIANYDYYSIYDSLDIKRADSKIFSFVENHETYEDSKNRTSYRCFNFDSQTGVALYSKDIFKNTKKASEIIAKKLLEKYDAKLFNALKDASESDREDKLAEDIYGKYFDLMGVFPLQSYIGYSGITVYFNSIELTNREYSEPQIIFMSFNECADIINNKYIYNGRDFVEKLPGNGQSDNAYSAYIEALGEDTVISIIPDIIDNYGYEEYIGFEVKAGDESCHVDCYAFEYTPIFVSYEGKQYVYLETRGENDYTSVNVFKIDDKGVTLVNSFEGSLDYMTDPANFRITQRMHHLSTFGAYRYYKVGDDGMPASLSKDYKIGTSNTLVVKTSFNAVILDPNTMSEDGGIVLKRGDELTFIATDGETYVDFRRQDDVYVRIYFAMEDYTHLVDGWHEEDLFEMLWYAG